MRSAKLNAGASKIMWLSARDTTRQTSSPPERVSSTKDTIAPAHPFLRHGGLGAVEIGTRLEGLSAGGGGVAMNAALYGPRSPYVYPSADRIWTTGVNWYWNKFIELTLNVNRESRAPAVGMSAAAGAIWSRTFRVEFGL